MPVVDLLSPLKQGMGIAQARRDSQLQEQDVARLQQMQGLQQQAAQQGVGSQAFTELAGMSPSAASKLKSILATDDQGLNAAFQDAKVLKHLLEQDPTGQSALNFNQQRIATGDSQRRNMIHSKRFDQEIRNSPSEALSSITAFASIPDEIKAQEAQPFQKADGGMVFDPNTGTYKIDPVASERLQSMAITAKADGGMNFKDRQSLNKDVTGILKDTVGIKRAAEELDKLKARGSAASKLGAVFKFMKALDPTSVVRESEQGQVYSASGAAAQLAGKLNSLLGEGQLTEAGFMDLVNTSKDIADANINSVSGQVYSLLDTFEDTIPQGFKDKVSARVPKPFKMAASNNKSNKKGNIGRFTVEVQ